MATTARPKTPQVLATITTTSGITRTAVVPARGWKSHIMRELPYATNVFGCTFTCERIS